jgi:hypothetical protein
MVMPAERPQGIAPLYVSHPSLRKQKVPISPATGGNLPPGVRHLACTGQGLLAALFPPWGASIVYSEPRRAGPHVRRFALPRAHHPEPLALRRLSSYGLRRPAAASPLALTPLHLASGVPPQPVSDVPRHRTHANLSSSRPAPFAGPKDLHRCVLAHTLFADI